ncbi:MAG: hypothetical protein R6X20_11035 [Phycisphaerae bacterium]
MTRPRMVLVLLLAAAAPLPAAEGIEVGDERPLVPDVPGKALQATPAAAFGDGVYLVVWREGWHGEGGRARLPAARVRPDGTVLDAEGIAVAPRAAGVQERPRVAFGGGAFLVVWQELRDGKAYDVLGARISPAGKVLDADPILVAAGPGNQALPDVASDGDGFLVVWQGVVREEDVPTYYSFARPVSADAEPGEARRLGTYPRPMVAWNGEAYLVVVAQTLVGMRLAAGGEPMDEGPQTIVRNAGRRHRTRAVAGGRGRWFVIAERSQPDYWGWGGPGAIQCKLVTGEGTLAPDLAEYIRTLPGNERNTRKYKRYDDWLDVGEKKERRTWPYGPAAVAWDGRQYVAVWQRHHIERKVMFANCDLVAARVSGWHSRDPAGVPVAASPAEEKWPALASDGKGGLLCAYERYGAEGGVRVVVRVLRTY